ncbi:hypothetical protein F4803DRAFT_495269 [Xylaria telfairii]|nr:hypothetical protein F4803DRAFT_495269 [Xylaria telfairii]
MRGNSSRRFHTKSRNGCGRCKQRRVKCDMKAPMCSHCRRRREECDYGDGSGSQASHVESVRRARSEPDAISINATRTSDPNTVDSNAILAHYMDTTSRTLWLVGEDGDEHLNPWREGLVPLLETLPFLYNIIISLSALHIYHCISNATPTARNPVRQSRARNSLPSRLGGGGGYESQLQADYIRLSSTLAPKSRTLAFGRKNFPSIQSSPDILSLAYSNQILGSRTFRQVVPAVDENNWIAVMGFTIAILVFRLESCRQNTTFSGVVSDTLLALRSAGVMGNEIKPFFLSSGSFGEFLMSRARRSAPKVVDPTILLALAHLKAINEEYKVTNSDGSIEQSTCARAIDSLQRWAIFVSGKPRTWLHYVWWPADVPAEFIDLVNNKSPVALLVFVYWCAVLGRAKQQWFLRGWATKAGGVAMAGMGPGWWDQGLDWPLQELGLYRGSVKVGGLSKGETLVRL